MTSELGLLKQRIERLDVAVGEIREQLAHCLQVAARPQDALVLARSVAESLLKRVLRDINLKPPAMLEACLRELEKPEVMSRGLVPSEILSLLHMVRVLGNKASHGSMRISLAAADVQLVLQSLLRVVEWYFTEFNGGPKLNLLSREPEEIQVLIGAQAYDFDHDPYCPQCGHWRHPGYETCPHCDRPICSYCDTILNLMQCGHMMPYGIAYCTICGEKAKPRPRGEPDGKGICAEPTATADRPRDDGFLHSKSPSA